MRRFVAGLVVGVVVATAAGSFAADAVRLLVNGREVFSDVPAQIIGGRTLVPARALAEALGATVTWDAERRVVVVTKAERTAVATVGAAMTIVAKGEEPTTQAVAQTPEWEDLRTLAEANKWTIGQSSPPFTYHVVSGGHRIDWRVEGGSDFVGTTDSGATIRGRVVDMTQQLNVPDLRRAGFLLTP